MNASLSFTRRHEKRGGREHDQQAQGDCQLHGIICCRLHQWGCSIVGLKLEHAHCDPGIEHSLLCNLVDESST